MKFTPFPGSLSPGAESSLKTEEAMPMPTGKKVLLWQPMDIIDNIYDKPSAGQLPGKNPVRFFYSL
jgi:hypothetical protein